MKFHSDFGHIGPAKKSRLSTCTTFTAPLHLCSIFCAIAVALRVSIHWILHILPETEFPRQNWIACCQARSVHIRFAEIDIRTIHLILYQAAGKVAFSEVLSGSEELNLEELFRSYVSFTDAWRCR
eukprot:s23_g78.t1